MKSVNARLLLASIIVTMVTTQSVQAASLCEAVFQDAATAAKESTALTPDFEFINRGRYRLYIKGSNKITSVVSLGSVTHDGVIYERFETSYGEQEIARASIIGTAKVEKNDVVTKLYDFIMNQTLLSLKMASLMTKPLKRLAPSTKTIEILGTLQTSKSVGLKMADSIANFDSHMSALGFEQPAQTRIIISDRPIFPELLGPFSLSIPNFNIWHGLKQKPVIAMSPILWKAASAKDESVLFHERTHSILHASYAKDAFINASATVQEALADFSAAHFQNAPGVGPNVGGENLPLRRIDTREHSMMGQTHARNEIMKATASGYHENSLYISNLLWRVRTSIGSNEMNSLLHPLIKTLNQYHPSYEQVLKAQNRVTSDKVVRFAQDLEFVIAVVKRSGDLHPDKVVGAKIRDEAHAYAESLGFSSAKIDRTSATLRLDVVTDYTAKNPQMQLVQSIFVKAYGVAGLAIEASVVYFIHGLLF